MKLTEQELSERVCFQKNMHAHPELSVEEKETVKSIIKILRVL